MMYKRYLLSLLTLILSVCLHASEQPQFVCAMTAWTLPADYSIDETQTFLEHIRRDGYNAVQMSAVFGEIDHNIIRRAFRGDDILKPNKK